MNLLRAHVVLSLASTLVLATCGSSGSSSSSGGPKQCAPANSNCTTAETTTYTNCVISACSSEYTTCLGANFMSGNFTGVCGTYFKCQDSCACNDTACTTACGAPSTDCLTCLGTLSTCLATCTKPACFTPTAGGTGGIAGGGTGGVSGGGTGGAGAGATCADLLACCNKVTDATIKSLCMADYSAVAAMGDSVCGAILTPTFKTTYCP